MSAEFWLGAAVGGLVAALLSLQSVRRRRRSMMSQHAHNVRARSQTWFVPRASVTDDYMPTVIAHYDSAPGTCDTSSSDSGSCSDG